LQFDKPFTYTAAVKDGKIDSRTTEIGANHAGGIIGFHTLRGEQVNVRVASSFISHEQAELNLKELGDRTLEEVAKAGRDEWNRVLGRIEVQDTDLDRIESLELTDNTFKLPKDFSASGFFSTYYGIVTSNDIKPERIIIRAYHDHIPYMKSLPLHASQRLLEEHDEYADFEVYLAPTYDFIMRLLHTGAMIEVISPASLRQTMKEWISDMYELYKND
jgi:hypothetical protein